MQACYYLEKLLGAGSKDVTCILEPSCHRVEEKRQNSRPIGLSLENKFFVVIEIPLNVQEPQDEVESVTDEETQDEEEQEEMLRGDDECDNARDSGV